MCIHTEETNMSWQCDVAESSRRKEADQAWNNSVGMVPPRAHGELGPCQGWDNAEHRKQNAGMARF